MLKDSVPKNIFNRLISIRDEIITKQMKKIEKRHNRKLARLRSYNVLKAEKLSNHNSISISLQNSSQQQLTTKNNDNIQKSDLKPITNLSLRKLAIDEENALKRGLHHVFPIGKFDNSRFVCDMEHFYAKLINLHSDYRHYEGKDLKQQIKPKLTSPQLSAAVELRSKANSFRKKAGLEMTMNNQQYKQIKQILRSLAKDTNIAITKPDKGHGIVIMDKDDYIRKMETLLEDQSKFKWIYQDPTVTNEDRVTLLLTRLLKEGFITNAEYNMAKPTGSRPARLYGLPKLHKPNENYPLCPVMSAIKTVEYSLGKMLRNRLKHLQTSPYVIKDSFDFLNKIKSSKNVDRIFISFDVVSLFTNDPLAYTIDLVLDQMYPTCKKSCLKLTRAEQYRKRKQNVDFRTLLEEATSKTHFTFNNLMYVQHNGVAVGAPLASVIADIFITRLKTTLTDK
ncbi:unnamed protein product [Rotaria sp. Silwood1]|nr:unnamed protein product [Rotaria sp. Silwood1]CAF1183790.1 unnamed protein product [Rotaria sp. Silwood1]